MAKITRELDELVAKEVITLDVAEKIRSYYKQEPSQGPGALVIAFGIIGALLIGMGVVLIIAHNWDMFSNTGKLTIGFAPLLIAQAVAGFIVFKNIQSQAVRESIGVILVFAIATSIAIVAQVYNIEGNRGDFELTWAILSIPVFYILRSRIASLLYWIIITWYATQIGFAIFADISMPVYYWLLALAALPFYVDLIRKSPNANAISFHSWVIGISMTFVFGQGNYRDGSDLLVPAYLTLFSVFILIGQLPYFAGRRLLNNAWLIGGSAGIIFTLLFVTFEWPDFADKPPHWWATPPLFMWIFLFVVASALLYIVGRNVGYRNVLSKSYTFLVFLLLFFIGLSEPLISRGLTNVLLLALGVYTIREGALANQLWKMNYGLLILAVLIGCRFFDTDMSFVIRGLLFVSIGVGFFVMNIMMIRKRKVAS